MSTELGGLLIIPAALVIRCLALCLSAGASSKRLATACEEALSRREIQRGQATLENRNNVQEAIEHVEDILTIADQIRAGELVPEEYTACQEELESLRESLAGSGSLQSLDALVAQVQRLDQRAGNMLQSATREAEREALVRLSLQYMTAQGCQVEARVSENGEVVTILGERSGKEMSIAIDRDRFMLADFSRGYEGVAPEACEQDLDAYISALQEIGVHVSAEYRIPKMPGKGGQDVTCIPDTTMHQARR
jgi:hypothetical protein